MSDRLDGPMVCMTAAETEEIADRRDALVIIQGNPDARDAARYRHLRKRGLVWADAAFMDADEGYLGHRQVGGELADAFCDFDMKRHEGR